jgi:hypothetical protein
MSSPTPLQSLLGGVGLSLPVHSLLVLNGSTLGISGFIHRAVLGELEAASALAGLVLGGAAVGAIEGIGQGLVIISGFLVGAGSKVRPPTLLTLISS